MRRSRRESGGEIAMMAVITKAMGAFLIIMVMLLPSYVGMRDAADEVDREVQKAQEQIEQAQAALAGGGLNNEDVEDLKRKLEEAKDALERARSRMKRLEARVDAAENEVERLNKETGKQKEEIAKLEEKQKTLTEEPFSILVDLSECSWIAPDAFDVLIQPVPDAQISYSRNVDGPRRRYNIRQLKPGTAVYVSLLRFGPEQAGADCNYKITATYKNGYWTNTQPLLKDRFIKTIGYYVVEEATYSAPGAPEAEVQEEEKIRSEPQWRALFAPDQPPAGSYQKPPDDFAKLLNARRDGGVLSPRLAYLFDEMVGWKNLTPEAGIKRLKELGGNVGDSKEVDEKPVSEDEMRLELSMTGISEQLAKELDPLLFGGKINLKDVKSWLTLFKQEQGVEPEKLTRSERRELQKAANALSMPRPLRDLYVTAAGRDFSLDSARQRLKDFKKPEDGK